MIEINNSFDFPNRMPILSEKDEMLWQEVYPRKMKCYGRKCINNKSIHSTNSVMNDTDSQHIDNNQ